MNLFKRQEGKINTAMLNEGSYVTRDGFCASFVFFFPRHYLAISRGELIKNFNRVVLCFHRRKARARLVLRLETKRKKAIKVKQMEKKENTREAIEEGKAELKSIEGEKSM